MSVFVTFHSAHPYPLPPLHSTDPHPSAAFYSPPLSISDVFLLGQPNSAMPSILGEMLSKQLKCRSCGVFFFLIGVLLLLVHHDKDRRAACGPVCPPAVMNLLQHHLCWVFSAPRNYTAFMFSPAWLSLSPECPGLLRKTSHSSWVPRDMGVISLSTK